MQRMKRYGILAFLALVGLGGTTLGAATLVHNPVLAAAAGQDVRIDASLVGATGDPRVRLYWRPRGKEIFRSIEMGGPASSLSALIPGNAVDVQGLEYYIEASLIQGGKKTVIAQSPATNPLLNPHAILVRKDETGPEVTPLNPQDGETLDSARPVITAAFGDADSGIDVSSVLVKVDGEPVKDKGNVQAFDSLVSYMPGADLSDGEHQFTVVVKDKAGNPGSAQWKVTIKASSAQRTDRSKQAWRWDSKVGAQTEYGHVISQSTPQSALPYRVYGLNTATLDVQGRGPADTVSLKVKKSDAERAELQPTDRYTAIYKGRQGVIALGDYSPNFSELSLYDLYQLRGITLDLQSGKLDEGHTRLVGVWGQTRRPVEANATSLVSGSGLPTFGQSLYGARWEFGGPWFQMGLNNVTVNDDSASVSDPGTQVARYNYIDTADVRVGLPGGLKLSGEAGLDLYSDPTPLLGTSLGSSYRAGLDWNFKPTDTKLSFDWKDLGGGFGLLPGGYTTVANPGLVPDYRGYEASFSQGLFDGQFSVDLNLNNWHDNLQASKSATTTTDFMSIFVNIAPERMPYLTVGWTQNGQVNDADGNTTTLTPNLVTDNKTTALNLGLGYTRSFGDQSTGSLNLNWNHQQYSDQAVKKLGQDLNNDNLTLSGFGSIGASSFNASVGLGSALQPQLLATDTALGLSSNGEKSSRSVNASLRWNQIWIRSVLDSYLGYDLSMQNSESKAVSTTSGSSSQDSRNTVSLGGNYNFTPEQRLGLGFAYAVAGTDTDYTTSKSSDSIAELYSNLRYDLSF